jgi:hypothetical protein
MGRSAAREALSQLKQFRGTSDLITVRVRTILHLKRIIGSGEVALSLPERSTLEELLAMMVKRWGKRLSSCLFESNSIIFLFPPFA